MDYEKIMKESIQDYNTFYEKQIDDVLNNVLEPMNIEMLKQLLHEKRKFGLKKYGELSFQSSFLNSMNSPTLEHAKEELVDCINYLAHEVYKSKLLYPSETQHMEALLYKSSELFMEIDSIRLIPK